MRMKKHQLLPLIFGGVAVLLIVLYFAVVRPLVANGGDTVTTTAVTDEGEGTLYNKGTLYPAIRREEMVSITVHNKAGTFRFHRLAEEGKEPTKKDDFVIAKLEGDTFTSYADITYKQERLSELVVATGSFYYHKNIAKDAEASGTQLDLSQYGLAPEQDPAWFEIETFAGDTVRVYVGDAAVTDNGYYVMVDGREDVYVSHTTLVGTTALCELPTFVDPTLTYSFVQTAYYFSKDFSFWRPAPEGYRLTLDDSVRFRYTSRIIAGAKEGDVIETGPENATQDLRTAQAVMQEAFLGKGVGDGGFTFTIEHEDSDKVAEGLRGRTVEYRIEEITGIDTLYIVLNYLNSSKRSDFHTGVAYKITAPAKMTGYLPSSNRYMGVLETIGELVGSETVDVGMTPEMLEKYGLDAYCIYYEAPMTIGYDKVNTDDIVVGKYLPVYLYISEKQEDGSYLVGSLQTNVVARVDGSTLSFLEEKDTFWLEDTMFSVNIGNATKLEFDFDYRDADITYTFLHEREEDDRGRFITTGVSYLEGGRRVNLEDYRSLYMHLVSIYYSGEYDGALPKDELLARDESVLTMRITLGDGAEYVYRFYPYSARHVLVSVEGEEGVEGAYFYALSSEVEKIYRDILLVLDGVKPDPDKQY